MFRTTWEIEVLINSYAEEKKKINESDWRAEEALSDIYARAIELTAREQCGLYMPVNMFIEWVEDGNIIDYDGSAYACDSNGNRIGSTHCNVKHINSMIEKGAIFVAWYNK